MSNGPRITLVPPLRHLDFVDAMRQAAVILTDSGGVQEEEASLGKALIVTRHFTERPDAYFRDHGLDLGDPRPNRPMWQVYGELDRLTGSGADARLLGSACGLAVPPGPSEPQPEQPVVN